MRVLALLAFWALFAVCQGCNTDEDCSLNGVCKGKGRCSKCVCDPGWFGDDCGRLDLAPATRGTGYNYTNVTLPDYTSKYGNSSWGGQILQDQEDKKLFHLIASQFDHGCGLGRWRPYSFIMRAESRTGPQGPYHYAQRVTGTFRHNPYAFWSPADKKYLLYTIGVDVEEKDGCQAVDK
jgi:hypothetical protein